MLVGKETNGLTLAVQAFIDFVLNEGVEFEKFHSLITFGKNC